jgi:hypothetical protein
MLQAYFHVLNMSTELPQILAVNGCANCVRELRSIGKSNADTRMVSRLAAHQSSAFSITGQSCFAAPEVREKCATNVIKDLGECVAATSSML